MGYDPKLLYGDEKVLVDTHPHWIMMVRSIVYVAIGTTVGILLLSFTSGWDNIAGDGLKWLGILIILGALLHLGHRLLVWYSTNFVITTDRCIYREGVIRKRGIEIPLDRINTVFFHQKLFERMVGAGTLHVESAGEMGMQRFEDVKDPIAVQNLLYQAMEDNENRKFDRMGAITNAHYQQAAPPAAAPAAPSVADEIAKLAALRDQGHLTQAEFEQQKATLLGGAAGPPPAAPPPAPPTA
ncbi:MAG: PH domain-containing protein [Microthrixaceae bacterium]